MNPKAIDDMGMAIADVYASVVDRIIINLAHHFPYVQHDQHIGSWQYQSLMLAQMGKVEQETIEIIAKSLGGADEALKQSIINAIFEGIKNEENRLKNAASLGLIGAIPPTLDPSQMQAFTYYYKQSADRLNLVNTVMLDSTKQAYQATVTDVAHKIANTQGILNAAAGEVVTGVSTWNGAMHSAVQKMVKNGITGFVDHAGHKWSPEAYVAMDVRTTLFNTARQAVWERQEQYGSDLYQVSSHNAARPLCYPWQGKVISTSGRTGTTFDIDGNEVIIHSQDEIESFRYGGGLFGVNCGHYPMAFIPNFSSLKGEPQDQTTNDKEYELTQQQRALERKLREEKRDLEVMKAQGAPAEQIKAQRERVRNASADIDEFCDKTGLPRRRNREYTPINATFPDTVPPITPIPPIQPPTPPPVAPPQLQVPVQNVAPQATNDIITRDTFANVKGITDEFKTGMAEKLMEAPDELPKKLFSKYADDLVCIDAKYRGGAKFSNAYGGTFMNLAKVAAGDSCHTPYENAFHEFGHMIDYLANGSNRWEYLSNKPCNGQQLLDVIKSDFKTFKNTIGVTRAGEVNEFLRGENMDLRTAGNISDILEKCTGESYPLGVGHGVKYHRNEGATEKEFFAEVLDSSVANRPAYDQMVRLFPNAVNLVWEMVKGVTQ